MRITHPVFIHLWHHCQIAVQGIEITVQRINLRLHTCC